MKHKLIFLGSPGAGKGTMAQRLAVHMGIPHISTGDIFRENIKNETPLGNEVKSILSSGALVPDALTIALVADRLGREDAHHGYILDGFPRTLAQADALATISTIDQAINFVVPQTVIIARLSGRLVCPHCNASFHKNDFPPQKEGICDHCGHALIVRKDDQPEAIKHRLTVYASETQPLIEYYKNKQLLTDLDSSQDMDKVFDDLLTLLAHTGDNR
ncbi:adenylate kinase [Entomospira culicis]|uniref:Adenylate kinase n=1 Tax=Entomospira culicis TaxID=2719989 RepID=A0A968KTU1_9SPIO|nr:adenylate kinase [Entomospira culicis]NIZ18594.1 adenylate kinase [Entomospira culicis]NIZ68809.1 adenylate kinase [Entomospira culicis]WDI37404.1 adenylate kinase [Entomospira culicis]WDI39033.1 adenylate kinase [Entomospira culicis]